MPRDAETEEDRQIGVEDRAGQWSDGINILVFVHPLFVVLLLLYTDLFMRECDSDMEMSTAVPFLPYKETHSFFFFILSSRTSTTRSLDCPQPHAPTDSQTSSRLHIHKRMIWPQMENIYAVWKLHMSLCLSCPCLSLCPQAIQNKQSHCPFPPYAVLWPFTFFFWPDYCLRSEWLQHSSTSATPNDGGKKSETGNT